MEDLIIHTDGGSRGNPGLAACAFVAEVNGTIVYQTAKFLNSTTNNVAEYNGVILALGWLAELSDKSKYNSIVFYLDSELVVKQINGLYKIKDEKLKSLIIEVKKLLRGLKMKVVFRNIPREKNKLADALLNKTLDEKM